MPERGVLCTARRTVRRRPARRTTRAVYFLLEDPRRGDFLPEDFLAAGLSPEAVRFEDAFFGTLAPASRASDNPIATACFGFVTFFPDPPLLSFPSLNSRMVSSTFCCAFLPYFAMTAPRMVIKHGKQQLACPYAAGSATATPL